MTSIVSAELDRSLIEKQNRPKSVLEMKRQLEGHVTGYGTLVGISEQYVVVSRTMAECACQVRCACDAADSSHTRPCGYFVDIKHNPPIPVIISVFDAGNGRPLVCPRCKGKDYEVNMERRIARLIQLEDSENHNVDVFQNVILYDDMVENLIPGEVVQVEGEMHVERKPGSAKNTKMDNVLHATSIKYLKKKEIVITENDIRNFYRWKEMSDQEYAKVLKLRNQYKEWSKVYACEECAKYAKTIVPMTFVDRLTAAFAPNVIGYSEAKLGLLRSIVGGLNRGDGPLAGKIHTFLVGDPGTAKSKLAEEAMRIKPNCRHISAPHASTKAITAIVDKESQVLRLGSIPLSDIVAIDEVTTFPIEDQSRLLGILQEQKFSKDAYGKHYEIPALTTIVATANPINTTWLNDNEISDNEIKMLKTLRDRFTQVYSFRDDNDTEEKRIDFAEKLSKIRKRPLPNYSYLAKYLIYVSSTLFPGLKPESERTLNKFWAQENGHRVMKNRSHNHMFKIAEAQAKLELKKEVDEDIATEVQKSLQAMVLQYGSIVDIVSSSSQVTYNKFIEILQNTNAGVATYELCEIACRENPQIADFLGPKPKWYIEHNIRLKTIVNNLRNHGNIREIKSKPIVLKWFASPTSDVSDTSDANCDSFAKGNDAKLASYDMRTVPQQDKPESDASDTSDRNDNHPLRPPLMQTCLKCGKEVEAFYARIHRCEET